MAIEIVYRSPRVNFIADRATEIVYRSPRVNFIADRAVTAARTGPLKSCIALALPELTSLLTGP